MKIGIIGSGVVGQTLGTKWLQLGHDVAIGTRDPAKIDDKKMMATSLREWRAQTGERGKIVSFPEAAAFGDILVNATGGTISIDALRAAGADKVGGKVLLDIANELDHSRGMPPRSLASDERCLAEKIQAAFPNLKVVKTLNTIGAHVMVNPKGVAGGDHTIFVSGNDAGAKAQVTDLLKAMGWTDILDLGDIASARGPEMYMAMWLRLWGATRTGNINIKVQR
ncbi:MAG TPA: NAD(P)-binding domain-containing protein [Polyangia bacterium]|nr:NAD(P)-binding domain-containing protein [Polyangia bacterium]